MRVDTKDLVQTFQSNGDALEDFVHDLVRQVGRSCGIDPVNIHWDYRTYVRDGGRDLVVNVRNSRADKEFIPANPSIWSIKSGNDGVSPTSLKSEIMADNHPKVREALQKGWSYVWCTVQPANHDQREGMQEAASDVSAELKVDPALVEFRWPEHLQGETNLYPTLIPIHLPPISSMLSDVLSLPH